MNYWKMSVFLFGAIAVVLTILGLTMEDMERGMLFVEAGVGAALLCIASAEMGD